VDGRSVLPLLRGDATDRDAIAFWQWNRYAPVAHCNGAVREGDWKLAWPWIEAARRKLPEDGDWYMRGLTEPQPAMAVDPTLPHRQLGPPPPPLLFHLADDPGESRDLSAEEPERVRRMTQLWDAWFDEMLHDWRRAFEQNTRTA
jgi:hypothetical protein